jgi:hypothetical protein
VLLTVHPVAPALVTAYVIAPPFEAGVVTVARTDGVAVEEVISSAVVGAHAIICVAKVLVKVTDVDAAA